MRLIKKGLHLQPVEVLIAGFYRGDKLISVRAVARGDKHQVRVPLGAVLGRARRIGATGVALAHNHIAPNSAAPSRVDILESQVAFEACWRCGVDLLDELILTERAIYSMRDFGHWPVVSLTYQQARDSALRFTTN